MIFVVAFDDGKTIRFVFGGSKLKVELYLESRQDRLDNLCVLAIDLRSVAVHTDYFTARKFLERAKDV